jgi:hypothetical protein
MVAVCFEWSDRASNHEGMAGEVTLWPNLRREKQWDPILGAGRGTQVT